MSRSIVALSARALSLRSLSHRPFSTLDSSSSSSSPSPSPSTSSSSSSSPSSPSSASASFDAKILLSESAVYLDNVAQTHVAPYTEDVIVSFANQVKQAIRMDKILRAATSPPSTSSPSLSTSTSTSSPPPPPSASSAPASSSPSSASNGNKARSLSLGEAPLSHRGKRIKNAEELVKTLYEAQQLGSEMQHSVMMLHDVHKQVAALEAKKVPVQTNSPLLTLLKSKIREQEESLEDHRLLRWYKANLEASEALVLESNFLDQLVGKSDKNYATEGYQSFLEKVKIKRRFMGQLRGNQTQEQFTKETKATLLDILDHYAQGSWDEIKYLTSPTMLAALRNSHHSETQGGWKIKLKVKKVDPEVDLLAVNEFTRKEYVPHFISSQYAAVTARFRYQVEYNVKNARGQLKFGGNLTKGLSFESKELTFVRQLSQCSFDDQPVDTFRESIWKLVAVK